MPIDKAQPYAQAKSIDKLSVLVPVYNEESSLFVAVCQLYKTLDKLRSNYEVIVVESNSTDNSRKILKELSAQFNFLLILEDTPKGKGHAVREAMKFITGDVFLIFDADLEYDPCDITQLLEPIELGQTAFVLGTRHKKGVAIRVMAGIPIRAKIMNIAHRFFLFLLNLALGTRMTDPFTMYKVFRKEVFDGIELKSDRFDFDWEIVIKAIRQGVIPIEVPVQYSSRSFAEGKKVRFFRDPITWIAALVKFRFIERVPRM